MRAASLDGSVDLIGSVVEWRDLARRLTLGVSFEVDLDAAGGGPLRLRVSFTDAPKLRVSVDGDELSVEGDTAAMACLASHVEFVAGHPPTGLVATHSHLEYFEGHPLVDPRSVPMVLARA